DAEVFATGTTAFFNGLDAAADRDFGVLLLGVLLGVFIVLVLLLRSLVAPIYMVATVLLSFGTALGVTTLLFQGILGEQGLAWWIPAFLFVLLVALGADYNIYLMSRVREEARDRSTVAAVREATRLTGGVITSAGLILAGTFAAMMSADMNSLVQMGFATTVGILLDTFVVRTFLVPSIATLLGRRNWWPSSRASAPAEAEAAS
ncbi:MAG: MMPL family transporter, partial [Nitriliruptorales bacterium]|nr:MMPL family transporter [Nitriliruptorales bacterium]